MTRPTAHVIADFSMLVIGTGCNTSKYICEIHNVLKTTGLNYKLHACGTNIEGPLDKVFDAVTKCINKLHEGEKVPRVETTLRLQTRTDKVMTIEESIKAVCGEQK